MLPTPRAIEDLTKKGKLGCFVEKGRWKNLRRKSLKNKRSSEGGESPPRKTLSAADKGQTNADSDSEAKKDGCMIFLGAIMGGFLAPKDTLRGTAKRKIVEVMETHGAPIKAA